MRGDDRHSSDGSPMDAVLAATLSPNARMRATLLFSSCEVANYRKVSFHSVSALHSNTRNIIHLCVWQLK